MGQHLPAWLIWLAGLCSCRGRGADAWAVTRAPPLWLLLTAPLPSSPMLPRCPPVPLH